MKEPHFRCRETTDPPHGHRPVRPPPPRPTVVPSPGWLDLLRRRLRALLASANLPRRRGLATTTVSLLRPDDVARILAACHERDLGEEP